MVRSAHPAMIPKQDLGNELFKSSYAQQFMARNTSSDFEL
jgi:hypothetical protein